MRILVTGHKGYIGTVMVPMLLGAGHEVVGLDSDLFRAVHVRPGHPRRAGAAARPPGRPGRRTSRGSTRSSTWPRSPTIRWATSNPEITYDINHAASVRLARLAKEAGVPRFLYSSSCSSYGAGGRRPRGRDRRAPPDHAPTRISKVRVEQDVARLADDRFSPTFLRNATAYGVSPRLRFDLVLNNLVAWAYAKGRVHIKSDGTPWRPIVHIEDIARAFLAVLAAPREVGPQPGAQRRARPRRTTGSASSPRSSGRSCPARASSTRRTAGPTRAATAWTSARSTALLPEFKPQWNARRGAEELYAAYRRRGLVLEDCEGPRFKRIDHLKQLLAQPAGVDATLRWTARASMAGCLLLRDAAAAHLRRSRHVAAVRELPHRRAAQPDGAVLSAARLRVRASASWSRSRSTCSPEAIFTEYAYFSSYSDSWLAHARPTRTMIAERLGLGAAQPGRRARQQRRLSAAVLRRARASRSSASSRRQRRRGGDRARACRRVTKFFGRQTARELVADGHAGRPALRQQRAGAGARPERLRRRHEAPARSPAASSPSSSRT